MTDTAVVLLLFLAAAAGAAAGSALTWLLLRRLAGAERPAEDAVQTALSAVATSAGSPDIPARTAATAALATMAAAPRVAPAEQPSLTANPRPASGSPVVAQPALAALSADILVVDDSAVARSKLRRLLESQGYSVQTANDGVEALALLDQGRYALMISDLEMPNMDGATLIRHCLARPTATPMPILAISGHENLRALFDACTDISGVHRKPWDDEVLASHVGTLLGPRSRATKAQPRRGSVAEDAAGTAIEA